MKFWWSKLVKVIWSKSVFEFGEQEAVSLRAICLFAGILRGRWTEMVRFHTLYYELYFYRFCQPSIFSVRTTQWLALVLPSRIRTPFLYIAARSRWTVRWTADKTTDNCCAEMKGLSIVNSHLFICLSDSLTTDKLTTSLTTLEASLLPFTIFTNWVLSIVTRTPPQKFSTLGIGIPAGSNPSRIFLGLYVRPSVSHTDGTCPIVPISPTPVGRPPPPPTSSSFNLPLVKQVFYVDWQCHILLKLLRFFAVLCILHHMFSFFLVTRSPFCKASFIVFSSICLV